MTHGQSLGDLLSPTARYIAAYTKLGPSEVDLSSFLKFRRFNEFTIPEWARGTSIQRKLSANPFAQKLSLYNGVKNETRLKSVSGMSDQIYKIQSGTRIFY